MAADIKIGQVWECNDLPSGVSDDWQKVVISNVVRESSGKNIQVFFKSMIGFETNGPISWFLKCHTLIR